MTPELVQKAVEALRKAEREAALAHHLAAQGKQGEAVTKWREIMGRYFPTS